MTTAPTMDLDVVEVWQGQFSIGSIRSAELAEDIEFSAATRNPHADATMEALAETASRCAPWIRLMAGPRLWQRLPEGEDPAEWRSVRRAADGELWREVSGLADWTSSPPTAYVARHCHATRAMEVMHHELWHLLEKHLVASDLAAVDRVVARGIARPGRYLDSGLERRARLYSAWATAWDEGWRPGWTRRVDRIFGYVHGGRLAKDLAREGRARLQTSARAPLLVLPMIWISLAVQAAWHLL